MKYLLLFCVLGMSLGSFLRQVLLKAHPSDAQIRQSQQIEQINDRYKKRKGSSGHRKTEQQYDQLPMEIIADPRILQQSVTRASMSIKDGRLHLTEGEQSYCARAEFKDRIKESGWDNLNMEIEASCDDKVGFLAAGYLEGLLSYDQIRHLWRSYLAHHTYHVPEYNGPRDDNNELKKSYELMYKIDEKFRHVMQKHQNQPRWQSSVETMRKVYAQQQGILRGYNDKARARGEFTITWAILMIINYDGANSNVIALSHNGQSQSRTRFMKWVAQDKEDQELEEYLQQSLRGHCSVLFKTVGDQMMMSHSTWDNYYAMQRVFKYLQVGNRRITYSSYPGCVSSTDDFFILHGNLVVTETSLDFRIFPQMHSQLFSEEYDYVPEYLQVMSANHLSISGKQWMDNMQLFRSCVYASQWMVFDQNAFETPSQDSFLYLVEDLFNTQPNKVYSLDAEVKQQGYFSSYNESIESKKFHINKRYLAFQHNQGRVKDHHSLQKVMAYNKQFMNDQDYQRMTKKQKKTAREGLYQSVALRMDTQDGGFGAIDIKTTDSSMIRGNSCFARNGPVLGGGLKPFVWNDPPEGQPKTWNFQFILMGPQL